LGEGSPAGGWGRGRLSTNLTGSQAYTHIASYWWPRNVKGGIAVRARKGKNLMGRFGYVREAKRGKGG